MKTIGGYESVVNSYHLCKWGDDCLQEKGPEKEAHIVLCLCVKSMRLWYYASGIILYLHVWIFFVVRILESRGTLCPDGFGGLVVSMLASGTRVRGFELGRSRWTFRASEKSSACLPSEGK